MGGRMDSLKILQGMPAIVAALLEDAKQQLDSLQSEIAFHLKDAGQAGLDLSPIIRKAWCARHRYVARGFGFLSPAALMLDEFAKDEALTELERLALHHWTGGILLRSTRAHMMRGNGSHAAERLAECFRVLGAADGLVFPSFAEAQARACAIKADRTRGAREKAARRHARTAAAKDAVRAAWASGKYSTRALCAEQEAAELGISFDTARKALRNTPDPA